MRDIDRSYVARPLSMREYTLIRRKQARFKIGIISGLLLLIGGACALSGIGFGIVRSYLAQRSSVVDEQDNSEAITPRPTISIEGTYSVTGEPTLSVTFINSVLSYYDSPAQGKGQALYDYGVQNNIDPAYALAFFMEESSFGTSGIATETHSLGNIRATEGEANVQGYRKYATWEDGFKDWYELIAGTYVQQWNLTTVDQIVPVYAPAGDQNDETQYINLVKLAVSTWRHGIVEV